MTTAAAAPPPTMATRTHQILTQATPPARTKNATMVKLLVEISDWMMTTGVGNNILNNKTYFGVNDSIFINGNMARTLMAAWKITGNEIYKEEGLRWCDAFVAKQLPITTSTGKSAGYWDTGYREIFIADTGTAVAALAVGYHLAAADRQLKYLSAMEKYALFVNEGCDKPPTNPAKAAATSCPPKGRGWVIDTGAAMGAIGDGWYMEKINLTPYTISTATTGSCAFVELDAIKPSPKLKSIAINAVRWIIKQMLPDGRIPYILTPASDNGHTTFQPITYSTESFIDVDLRYPGSKKVLLPLKQTVLWLVGASSANISEIQCSDIDHPDLYCNC